MKRLYYCCSRCTTSHVRGLYYNNLYISTKIGELRVDKTQYCSLVTISLGLIRAPKVRSCVPNLRISIWVPIADGRPAELLCSAFSSWHNMRALVDALASLALDQGR
jgi:hypothetical protein